MRQLDQFRRRAARHLEIEAVTVAPARGLFSLSFDDFPESAWSVAGPILADHGVLASYYVCGGLERGTNLDLPQFTTEQLQALHAAGHEIGCHTFGHDSVLRLAGPALIDSLDRNARWVAERLDGYRMQTFAYPFGDASLSAKRVLRDRFDLARGVREGLNLGREDRMLIKSFGMESRRLPGYDLPAMMAEAADKAGWLTAYAHDVSDNPTPYGCTPADLDHVLTLAKQAGLAILPVAGAWGECVRRQFVRSAA
ncbi:polysaccharide deacetylase family protein [Brevundimonas halotolerans]|uniref:Chitooligosaccharide deacetylase n=1 Tax=Brevundimonas halotolerans TaxID=69670 RepID=A0A7W9E7D9_9CAUL|nr:polysaccharide deacetylase family protein [Brevundimonas halotolerans]MBB5659844.1 peptidoglycan/xylan/chitin deacetylase (PgdA/CDA1 family) [Brevundimonas halotolerans]